MFSFKEPEDQGKIVTQGDGQALVLSFQSSVQPVLWRASLSANPDLAFQVIEQDGGWILGVVVPAKPFAPIAQFVTRDEADAAFAVARTALLGGSHRSMKPWTVYVAGFVLLAGVVMLATSGSSKSSGRTASLTAVGQVVSGVQDKTNQVTRGALISRLAPEQTKVEDGVPLTADDVVTPPPED